MVHNGPALREVSERNISHVVVMSYMEEVLDDATRGHHKTSYDPKCGRQH